MFLWETEPRSLEAVAVLQTARHGLHRDAVEVIDESISALLFANTDGRVNTSCDYCGDKLRNWPVGTPAICWECVERSL